MLKERSCRRTLPRVGYIHRFGELLRSNQYAYAIGRWTKRRISWALWRIRVAAREKHNKLHFDQIFWVDPMRIELCTPLEFDPIRYDGAVIGCDWDITELRFSDLDVYGAFEEHFVNGTPWHDTQFVKNTIQKIRNNYVMWRCVTEESFEIRLSKLDALYQRIQDNGYRPQRENIHGFLGTDVIDEVSVNLSRKGELLFNNGAHRLAIAKILQISSIPVRITVCHALCADPNACMARHTALLNF